jgi:phosphoserine phosphatase
MKSRSWPGTGESWSAEVTERAMRGELDFAASLRQRVATLKGADAAIFCARCATSCR